MPDRGSWTGLGRQERSTLDKDSFGGYLGFMSLRLHAIEGSWRRRSTSSSSIATAGSAAPSTAGMMPRGDGGSGKPTGENQDHRGCCSRASTEKKRDRIE